ncbi:MAG: hypothetical protein ACK5JT_24405 [Hyphomicrobiaceae bacterium]
MKSQDLDLALERLQRSLRGLSDVRDRLGDHMMDAVSSATGVIEDLNNVLSASDSESELKDLKKSKFWQRFLSK